MDDLISRHAVVLALDRIKMRGDETWYDYYHKALDAIAKLPPVDAVPVKRGRWYKPGGMMPPEYAGVYRCSECDRFAMRDWKSHKQVLSDYCPWCGARMEDSDG